MKTQLKKIVLNWMPPAMIGSPAPSLSILKQYLTSKGYNVDIVYWNLILSKLEHNFLWSNAAEYTDIGDENSLLIYINYLAHKTKDEVSLNLLKARLISTKPQFQLQDSNFIENHMLFYANELDKYVDEIVDKIVKENVLCYGMSTNLYQWVFSSIVAKKIKDKKPECKIIIGGIGTKEAAVSYLKRFDQFDFAIWGEGEYALLSLCEQLEKCEIDFDYEDLTNTAFRGDNTIKISKTKTPCYIDLSSPDIRPDFSDYINKKKETEYFKSVKLTLPIESSRGCHWHKCHFCYLNTGYRYRLKSIDSICSEIRQQINNSQPDFFSFLDNDIIGKDINRFDQLLDELSKIKEETPNFTISLAEVITKGINSDIIKKMALAGFIHVQIGYESPSNSLLTKINKKNTFASNMLFIKYGKKYKINIGGANVIMGMYEEEDEDIIEGINNLPLQRFFLKEHFFSHNASPLGVMHSSRYFKFYEKEVHLYEDTSIGHLIPLKYNQFIDKDLHITEKIKTKFNPLWNSFFETEKYYLTNNYEYELLSKRDSILYREYLNSGIINELEFERGAIDWIILEFCNDSVRSINEIVSLLKTTSHPELLDIELYNIIDELYVERLVYVSDNYSEIVTIIDTKLVL